MGETGLPEQLVSEGRDDYSRLRADVSKPEPSTPIDDIELENVPRGLFARLACTRQRILASFGTGFHTVE